MSTLKVPKYPLYVWWDNIIPSILLVCVSDGLKPRNNFFHAFYLSLDSGCFGLFTPQGSHEGEKEQDMKNQG